MSDRRELQCCTSSPLFYFLFGVRARFSKWAIQSSPVCWRHHTGRRVSHKDSIKELVYLHDLLMTANHS